jgi:hypothetical protein
MFTQEMKRRTFGEACRSGFHQAITPLPLIQHIAGAKFDCAGAVIVVGLSSGVLILMRLLLAN